MSFSSWTVLATSSRANILFSVGQTTKINGHGSLQVESRQTKAFLEDLAFLRIFQGDSYNLKKIRIEMLGTKNLAPS